MKKHVILNNTNLSKFKDERNFQNVPDTETAVNTS